MSPRQPAGVMFTKVRLASCVLQVNEVGTPRLVGAVHARRRDGHGLQPPHGDLLLAVAAEAVDAARDAVLGLAQREEPRVETPDLARQVLARRELLRRVVGLRALQLLELDELPVADRSLLVDLLADPFPDGRVDLRDVVRLQGNVSVHVCLLVRL